MFWRGGLRAQYALDRLLAECRTRGIAGRCLDLGCGRGDYYRQLAASGQFETVHGLDSNPALARHIGRGFVRGRMEDFSPEEPYDVIWCSHVLEHTPNPGQFLQRLHVLLREDGLLCISVPPMKQAVTVGHVTLWTPGLLLLNLVKAGYDCSDIRMKRKGYNIAALLLRKPCPQVTTFDPDAPASCRPYLPAGLKWHFRSKRKVWNYKGDFRTLNW
jgi:SAM-dependent methyltransferase